MAGHQRANVTGLSDRIEGGGRASSFVAIRFEWGDVSRSSVLAHPNNHTAFSGPCRTSSLHCLAARHCPKGGTSYPARPAPPSDTRLHARSQLQECRGESTRDLGPHSHGSRSSLDDYLKIVLLADVKLVLRQFLNCQGRSLQRGVQVHVDDCPLLTRFYVIAGFTLMSSQGALRAALRTAREVVRCAGNVSWLNILMDQSLLVSRSQATATCALCRHAASEALPELGSTAPAWRPAEKPLCRELCGSLQKRED